MRTGHGRARAAVGLVVLVAVAVAFAAPAAAFSYTIDVVGDGVSGTGSIVFPADAGDTALGVDLSLSATMFGNPVTFTEADILGVDWLGADPGDVVDFVLANLALAAIVGADTFLLTDNGGALGDAVCTDASAPFTACGGSDIALAVTAWTYTPGAATPVSEPSTMLLVLAGLGAVVTGRALRNRRAQASQG
jgi:hypothetical protein